MTQPRRTLSGRPISLRLRSSLLIACVSLIAGLGLIACSRADGPGPNATPEQREAAKTFRKVCATCHGENGNGQGPGAAALHPKPRSFQDSKWQASVTDEHIKRVILYGGSAVGKSAGMPAHPQLRSQSKVVDALVERVRKFGRGTHQ